MNLKDEKILLSVICGNYNRITVAVNNELQATKLFGKLSALLGKEISSLIELEEEPHKCTCCNERNTECEEQKDNNKETTSPKFNVNEVIKPPSFSDPMTEPLDIKDRRIKLYIVKCPECGSVCTVMNHNGDDAIQCFKCGGGIDLTKTYLGDYSCDCGCNATFYMNEELSTIKCKDCGKEYYLTKEKDSNRYHAEAF